MINSWAIAIDKLVIFNKDMYMGEITRDHFDGTATITDPFRQQEKGVGS